MLPQVISSSVEGEVHPDYSKGVNSKRGPENGHNKNVLIHRFYGAVDIEGSIYRVKNQLKPGQKTSPTAMRLRRWSLLEIPNCGWSIVTVS